MEINLQGVCEVCNGAGTLPLWNTAVHCYRCKFSDLTGFYAYRALTQPHPNDSVPHYAHMLCRVVLGLGPQCGTELYPVDKKFGTRQRLYPGHDGFGPPNKISDAQLAIWMTERDLLDKAAGLI